MGVGAAVVKPTSESGGLARGSLITYCFAAACSVMLLECGDPHIGEISCRSLQYEGRHTLGMQFYMIWGQIPRSGSPMCGDPHIGEIYMRSLQFEGRHGMVPE